LVRQCSHGCEVHSLAEVLQEVADADIPAGVKVLSTFVHSGVSAQQLDRLPDVRLVATRSTGFDHVDLDASPSTPWRCCWR